MTSDAQAPELATSMGWLNTDRPLRLDGELHGQVVVLDFWTYCCINCMHILPDLAFLEHKYRDEPVTFIGVHSAKFTNEASRETILAAILRYEIQHPVIIDEEMKLWRSYRVRSWPTQVVIGGDGSIVGAFAGEGNRETVDAAVTQALAAGRARGILADGPMRIRRDASVQAASSLAFPGKVCADAGSGRLFIADSNHNRIVVAKMPDQSGRAALVRAVGSGRIGRADGAAEVASFNHPQGLVCGQGKLYVADTENHLIRAIDLESFEVTTVVGTGVMGQDRAGGAMGISQEINSPWDLTMEGATLYVAMAGSHQVWRIDMPVGFARAFAGTGRENIADGPTETAAFAQPSGICLSEGSIFIADSEVSAIRRIDMAAERVFTIVGEGLFSFGDVDGVFPKARLQHPLGIAPWNGTLLVADTYNHKIKQVFASDRSVKTLYGSGRRAGDGGADSALTLFEPGGISVVGDVLLVADTNNHRIVRINLNTGAWCEVFVDGLNRPHSDDRPTCPVVRADPVAIAPDADVVIELHIELPAGCKINADAPWSVRVQSESATIAQQTGKSAALPLTVMVPAGRIREDGELTVTASLAYCADSQQPLCIPVEIAWRVPIETRGKTSRITLSGSVGDVPT